MSLTVTVVPNAAAEAAKGWASAWVGPAIVGVFLPLLGVAGVMWIFAFLYVISAVLTMFMKVSEDPGAA